jgi:hypothetical protein
MPLVMMTDDRKADWVARRALCRRQRGGGAARDEANTPAWRGNWSGWRRLLIADDPNWRCISARRAASAEARMREAAHWRARFPRLDHHLFGAFAAALDGRAPSGCVFLSPVFATASHTARVR